ncbi:Fur family transcriptional regulator [Candidatus Uabimicrobium amorphum]|uniref:Peroxide-responsive repressor PerR n=1 Tax=Uabimicrobium amorphum TaxID=2596890 RepID=A0A5S9IKB6_UABAM|nr:peroxide-responsive repressor PerR [Candidatus Uabimicrobium amorphum]
MGNNNLCSTHILRQAKISNTKVRKSILEFLMKNHGPFSIDEIHEKISTCDSTTVYRCIKKFEKCKIVERCDFGDNISRYEYKCSEHHHHIMCRNCNRIDTVKYCFVKEMEKVLIQQGYKEVSHKLEFFGICQDCQNSNTNSEN